MAPPKVMKKVTHTDLPCVDANGKYADVGIAGFVPDDRKGDPAKIDPIGRILRNPTLKSQILHGLPDKITVATAGGRATIRKSQTLEFDRQEYPRPNGDTYFSRAIRTGDTMLEDIAALRECRANGIPVCLFGPPGTGKTALIEAAFPDVVTLTATADTDTSDFLGSHVQLPDHSYVWIDNPLLIAADEGRPLFVDDISMADPRELAVLYSVMDGRDTIRVTQNPARGEVHVKDGFYVISAYNPDAPGSVVSEALSSRFSLQIEVLTDFDLAEEMGVPREIVIVARNLQRKRAAGTVVGAPQMRELLAFAKIDSLFGRDVALANFVSTADSGDRKIYLEQIKDALGRATSSLVIE